jgi:hypothetical protein
MRNQAHPTYPRGQQTPYPTNAIEQWQQFIEEEPRARVVLGRPPAVRPGLRGYSRPRETDLVEDSDGLHQRGRALGDLRRAYAEQQTLNRFLFADSQGNPS